MVKRISCEQDLKSENATKWAEAVMQCQTRNPYCGADGYCHADGECFEKPEPLTLDQALERIETLTVELDAANVKINQMLSRLDREINVAKKLGKSERLFALRFVKTLINEK